MKLEHKTSPSQLFQTVFSSFFETTRLEFNTTLYSIVITVHNHPLFTTLWSQVRGIKIQWMNHLCLLCVSLIDLKITLLHEVWTTQHLKFRLTELWFGVSSKKTSASLHATVLKSTCFIFLVRLWRLKR